MVDGMGGGFGSKSRSAYGRLAVALSRQAGAPVRLTLTRPEEQVDWAIAQPPISASASARDATER